MARTGLKKQLDIGLWKRWRMENDRDAGEQLVKAYLPLVHYVVGRVASGLPGTVDKDDLYSYGQLGLLDAMKKFDFDRGLQFETYAMWRIRGAIVDGMRNNDVLPRSVRDKVKKIEEAYQSLEQRNLRTVTEREVSEYLGISEKDIAQVFTDTSFASRVSLDETTQDEEEQKLTRKSFVSDVKAEDPQKALDTLMQKQLIKEAIEKLTEKERTVISLVYFEELSLTEIAEILRLSPSRISQIHSKALSRIRSTLETIHV